MGFFMLILAIIFFVLLHFAMNDSKVQSYRRQKEIIDGEMQKYDIGSKEYNTMRDIYNNLDMEQKAYQAGKATGIAMHLGAVDYIVGKENEERAENLKNTVEHNINAINDINKELKEKYGF